MELYARVRRACMVEGMSLREASRVFGRHGTRCARCWPTRRRRATGGRIRPAAPTLRQAQEEPCTGVIDAILESDLSVPRKQRHTAKRIFERRAGRVWVRRSVHHRQGLGEGAPPPVPGDVRAPVPLPGAGPVRLRRGPGGHRGSGAQGPLLRPGLAPQRRLLRQGLPPADTTAAFRDGHLSAFAFLGGVPQSIL